MKGLGIVHMDIVPFHRREFAAAKPGKNSGDINRLSRPSKREEVVVFPAG